MKAVEGTPQVQAGLSALFGPQIVFKVISFVLSCLALPTMTVEWYGLHSLHLFFFVTITAWPRNECCRKVVLRFPPSNEQDRRAYINVLRLCTWITIALTLACASLWLWWPPALVLEGSPVIKRYYLISMGLHTMAALLSVVGEKEYTDLLFKQDYRAKTLGDGIGSLVHTLVFAGPFILLRLSRRTDFAPQLLLICSGAAQVAWSMCMIIISAIALGRSPGEMFRNMGTCLKFPEKNVENSWYSRSHQEFLRVESFTSIQKLIVSEGDKVLQMRYLSHEAQGGVAMVQNLSSVILRMFFAPQEEMLAIHYSKERLKSDNQVQSWTLQKWYEHYSTFRLIAYVQWSMGIAIALFGPLFAEPVLLLLYGRHVARLHTILEQFSYVIGMFALCGILEGFGNASSPPPWLRFSQRMTRVSWICVNVIAVAVWEARWQVPKLASKVSDYTVWMWTMGLVMAFRSYAPFVMAVHFLKASNCWSFSKCMRIFFHHWWLYLLPTLLLLRVIDYVIPTTSALDQLLTILPENAKDRILATELVYCAVCGLATVVLIAGPVILSSRQKID